jgi:hypothetical protein
MDARQAFPTRAAEQSMKHFAKRATSWARRYLGRRGYRLMRLRPEVAGPEAGGPAASSIPPETKRILQADNPRLLELQRRYAALSSPLAAHTMWVETYRRGDLDLAWFRADNVYVWQLRNVRAQARIKYFLYGRYVRALDTHSLLERLGEDGLFGCWTFSYKTLPPLSRDLLDSVNELYFLDREFGLFSRDQLRVLDIGAGYGRLAHRMHQALPRLARYDCIDAVAESTFLCEFYTGFRGCADKVRVVPLDEVDRSLRVGEIDLAVNIHSFSETGLVAINAWLDELCRLRVPWLLIVPNDGEKLLSWESDRSRRDYSPLLEAHGYHLRRNEPTVRDDDLRELIRARDHFMLFEHDGKAR